MLFRSDVMGAARHICVHSHEDDPPSAHGQLDRNILEMGNIWDSLIGRFLLPLC